MQTDNKKTFVYPAIRFIPDTDEKGVFLIDPRTKDYKSGTLEVQLFESGQNGDAQFVGGIQEQVSFTKYKSIREDIDHMSVDELRKYFPGLVAENAPADEPVEPSKEELEKQVAALTQALEKANEKKSTPKSTKATGKTDGKSGTKKTEQKSQSSDKANAKA